MTNLLDNAAKWSPPDGVVTVRLADGALTVDDQGAGIAEADLPHVFDRFYRSEESRSMPGSGLGLSIVRRSSSGTPGRSRWSPHPLAAAAWWSGFPARPRHRPGPTRTQTPSPPDGRAARSRRAGRRALAGI